MKKAFYLCFILLFLVACSPTIPKDAFVLSPTSLEDRQLQSRKFATLDRTVLLAAGAAVLQDMGYAIDESNASLGVLTASKQADATSGAQIAGAVLVALIGGGSMPIDKEQKIRICLVVNENLSDSESSIARITFQRIVWNTQGQISRVETLKEPELYQGFFEKLSKSAFLEAHQI
ncbi:MAG: hypothetical protein GYB33_10105 [Gammaproteobacteria bacterium]|uniref:hypothetical protein n=1 Tax=Pseudomaricurvus alcaniphilus TaxID=1166482 RepID=UPI0014089CAD|nr:hypothetical protein [Pseudomaricurvus alcaniphilus]MBR9910687.1 hypothetical protein [Gammaproteobacteria bacterium]NHN39026.1 hypothetical protein [Pseudomaricurvus alcaniphilus]